MSHTFDPGGFAEPFRTLCMNYPEADVYVPGQFRVEWDRSSTGAGWTAQPAFW